MVTLVGEVFYYRRKRKVDASNKLQVLPKKQLKNPPLHLANAPPYPVTIGTTFKPVNMKHKLQKEKEDLRLSHITLYPRARNAITRANN